MGNDQWPLTGTCVVVLVEGMNSGINVTIEAGKYASVMLLAGNPINEWADGPIQVIEGQLMCRRNVQQLTNTANVIHGIHGMEVARSSLVVISIYVFWVTQTELPRCNRMCLVNTLGARPKCDECNGKNQWSGRWTNTLQRPNK